MIDERVILSIIWIAVMLTYLLGDVIRIFAGDVVLGEINGAKSTQAMGLGSLSASLISIEGDVQAVFLGKSDHPIELGARFPLCFALA